MFSEQTVFCNACGNKFETTFHVYGGHICSQECFDIIEAKKTAAILGKKYMSDNKSSLCNMVEKVFEQGQKGAKALEEYRRTINRIDDFFEYANESKKDREKVHEILDSLNDKLLEIYND